MTAMPRQLRSWWYTLVIAIIGVAIHIHAYARHVSPVSHDSGSYVEPAAYLLRDWSFSARDAVAYAAPPRAFNIGPVKPATIRTPLYPLVIALVLAAGGTLRLLVLLQHALAVFVAVALHRFLQRFTSAAASAAAALLCVAHPAVTETANVLQTETIAGALIAAATAAFYVARKRESWGWSAVSGVLLGTAILTRPIVLYLPIALLTLLVVLRSSRRVIAVFAVAAALLPAVWMFRNYDRAGVATVSSIEGENLLLYRAAGALVVARKPPLDAVFALQKQFGFYHEARQMRVPLLEEALRRAEADGRDLKAMNHAQRSRYYASLGLRTLAAHPVAYAEVATSSAIALFIDDYSGIFAARGAHIDAARLLFVPLSLFTLCCVVIGVRRLFSIDGDAAWTLSITLAYFAVFSSGPEVEPRFIVPFLGLYAAAAGIGLGEVWSWVRALILPPLPQAGSADPRLGLRG